MTKVQLSVIVVVVSIAVGILVGLNVLNNRVQNTNSEIVNIQQQAVPSPSPRPGIPKNILIPTIGVNAYVEEVGLDTEGRMDVPKLAEHTAWYNLNSRPGEIGNTVIDGHLDKKGGAPAVFYNLINLEAGDEIITTDEFGKTFTYNITEVVTYEHDEVPLEYIFGKTKLARLNLITCRGAYDSIAENYSHRVVVYSELSEEQTSFLLPFFEKLHIFLS